MRLSFLVLTFLAVALGLCFVALIRWSLGVREEARLTTGRLERLARTIQPLSAVLEHDPTAVVLADAAGLVVYANAASHRLLNADSPLQGQAVAQVFENLGANLKDALTSGQDGIVAKTNGNEEETLLVSSRELTLDGSHHYLYLLRPVTQEVRRQEVEHWKKIIRVLSHELNNTLAPITSLLSSARKVNQMKHQDPRLGDILEGIAERTRHLVTFIEGYREIAQLSPPRPCEIEWPSFMDKVLLQKSIGRQGALPGRAGYFDPRQMQRVLSHLIANALESGSPVDEVLVDVEEQPTGFRLRVVDRGTGMPDAVLAQATLPFFSTKRSGTGIGLALSREIIEAHGGSLSVANREGGGLSVACFLPDPAAKVTRPSLARIAVQELSDLSGPSSEPPT